MRKSHLFSATLLLSTLLAGCDGMARKGVQLPPPELFTWTGGQPVSFSPPPAEWKRSRYQNGGAEGIDFVLAGSKGEMIFIAERFFLGKRDRCARIKNILENLDDYDRRTFTRDLQKARLYASKPYNAHEERTVEVVNGMLDDARENFLDDFIDGARVELERALEQAATIRFTVGETVDKVLFTAKKNQVFPELKVDDPVEGELAGESALSVWFTFNGHGTPMVGRRLYVVKNNRMFEIGFQGLHKNMPLFDAILASISFPPGPCEH
jgi:hypothetical protein